MYTSVVEALLSDQVIDHLIEDAKVTSWYILELYNMWCNRYYLYISAISLINFLEKFQPIRPPRYRDCIVESV